MDLNYRCGGSAGFIHYLNAPASRLLTVVTPETADSIKTRPELVNFASSREGTSLTKNTSGITIRASSGALIAIRVKREVGEKPTLPPQR